jgi:hypothetical protein
MIFVLRIELTYFVVVPIAVGDDEVEFDATSTLFDMDKHYCMKSVEAKMNNILISKKYNILKVFSGVHRYLYEKKTMFY